MGTIYATVPAFAAAFSIYLLDRSHSKVQVRLMIPCDCKLKSLICTMKNVKLNNLCAGI